jgi:L-fucose mutarotase/ribose pyranase (RbsD/FucU family)
MADMHMPGKILQALPILLLSAAALRGAGPGARDWKQTLRERLPLYGHRNWIVIADSAYPAQSRDGIETIVSGADQMEVLREVLKAVNGSKHVRPIVHVDRELASVPEAEAPGVEAYRSELKHLFEKQAVTTLPHEQIIDKLDKAAQVFRVLIIKTDMTIPYTSVFLQLDCGYWNAEQEKRLRSAMEAKGVQ